MNLASGEDMEEELRLMPRRGEVMSRSDKLCSTELATRSGLSRAAARLRAKRGSIGVEVRDGL